MHEGAESPLALGAFFYDEITASKEALGVAIPPDAEMYTVQLLVRYATLAVDVPVDKPLALQWADANEVADPHARRREFLKLGDAALLKNGFLTEPDSKAVSSRYVCSIGGSAYAEVARLSSRAAAGAFVAISETFELLCRLMHEIRLRYAQWDLAQIALAGPDSPAAARRIREAGLVLIGPADA